MNFITLQGRVTRKSHDIVLKFQVGSQNELEKQIIRIKFLLNQFELLIIQNYNGLIKLNRF